MMNNPLTDPNNSPRMKLGILLLGIGLLILGCNFAIMSRYIFLDVFGTKTNGELVVHRYSCITM